MLSNNLKHAINVNSEKEKLNYFFIFSKLCISEKKPYTESLKYLAKTLELAIRNVDFDVIMYIDLILTT